MAQFPSLPLFTDAYLADTTHLTTIEHGAYLLLLIVAWRSPDCGLPKNSRELMRYTKLSSGQFNRIWPTLEPFFYEEDGRLFQGRLLDELETVKRLTEQRSNAGKASALKRNKRKQRALARNSNGKQAPTPTPTPTIDTNVSISQTRKDKTNGATRLSEDWQPNARSIEVGRGEGYTDDETRWTASGFADYWRENGKLKKDWNRCFYNWLRSDITRRSIRERRKGVSGGNNTGNKSFAEIAHDTLAR